MFVDYGQDESRSDHYFDAMCYLDTCWNFSKDQARLLQQRLVTLWALLGATTAFGIIKLVEIWPA